MLVEIMQKAELFALDPPKWYRRDTPWRVSF